MLDRDNGTKIGFGANFEKHELGAQPLVLRDGGDFYDRASDFDESTEIDRNQQFLTFEHELDGYSFFQSAIEMIGDESKSGGLGYASISERQDINDHSGSN